MGRRGQGGRGGGGRRCVVRKVSLGGCVCSDGCLVLVLFFFIPIAVSSRSVVWRCCARRPVVCRCAVCADLRIPLQHGMAGQLPSRELVAPRGGASARARPSHLCWCSSCQSLSSPLQAGMEPRELLAHAFQSERAPHTADEGADPEWQGTTCLPSLTGHHPPVASSGAAQAGLNAGDAPRVRRAPTRAGVGWLWRRPLCPKVEGDSLFPP